MGWRRTAVAGGSWTSRAWLGGCSWLAAGAAMRTRMSKVVGGLLMESLEVVASCCCYYCCHASRGVEISARSRGSSTAGSQRTRCLLGPWPWSASLAAAVLSSSVPLRDRLVSAG